MCMIPTGHRVQPRLPTKLPFLLFAAQRGSKLMISEAHMMLHRVLGVGIWKLLRL